MLAIEAITPYSNPASPHFTPRTQNSTHASQSRSTISHKGPMPEPLLFHPHLAQYHADLWWYLVPFFSTTFLAPCRPRYADNKAPVGPQPIMIICVSSSSEFKGHCDLRYVEERNMWSKRGDAKFAACTFPLQKSFVSSYTPATSFTSIWNIYEYT